MIKLSKKNQILADEWAARVEAEGLHVGMAVKVCRVETGARNIIERQWWEPAVLTEVRTFDAVARFADGTESSTGLGLRVPKDSSANPHGLKYGDIVKLPGKEDLWMVLALTEQGVMNLQHTYRDDVHCGAMAHAVIPYMTDHVMP